MITVPKDFCDSCGHEGIDHVQDEDYSYCIGEVGTQDCPICSTAAPGESCLFCRGTGQVAKPCKCKEYRPKCRGIIAVYCEGAQ